MSAEVEIVRDFDAPRELVFRAWTDPAHLVRWYCPPGCTIEVLAFEARPGGALHTCLRNPQFHDCWSLGEFREVDEPSKLSFTFRLVDPEGKDVSAAEAGMDPEWPMETVVTVTFEDLEGKTRMRLRQNVSEALAKRTGAYPSWLQMFDRLEETLNGETK